MTQKEKALNVIVKQIKELDKNTLALDVLDARNRLYQARTLYFDIISENGYELTKDYKLVLKK